MVDAEEWLKHCIGAGRVVWVDANELELLQVLSARMVARPLAVSVACIRTSSRFVANASRASGQSCTVCSRKHDARLICEENC